MDIYIDGFFMQKAGNAESEYEDAFWPSAQTMTLQGKTARVAVADGATDAVFSGLWAQLLVRAYGKRGMRGPTVQTDLEKAGQVWERVIRRRPLHWYTEEKARLGAYAALIGLEISQLANSTGGSWSALACGDSCFFHLRSNEIIASFPISRSEEFTNAPLLLGSDPRNSGVSGTLIANGHWQEGDCFYLMTDALAAWFLANYEKGTVPWQDLRNVTLAEKPTFKEWISALRQRQEIKNDDCTLISVSFEHCREF